MSALVSELPPERVRRLRRACFSAFGMLVIQYGIGNYVNLYVPVPGADHGRGVGQAIGNGPAWLTVHIVVGLLLIAAAIGVLVQAVLARRAALIGIAAAGLTAMIGAAAAGGSFVSSGSDGASMAMAALAAAGLLCYGAGLYLLSPGRS